MALIDAYRRDTGQKVRIPEHWIGHPRLGAPFSKTPSQKARENAPKAPARAGKKSPHAEDPR
ncbi:hypothetical protein [Oerskovia turbata]